MSTEGNSEHIKMLKRTQNERNISSTYTVSSSEEELPPRKKKVLPNLVLPGSSGKATSDRKCTKKNRFRASQKKRTRVSAAMHDLEKFSKSLIKDLKVENKKMLAQFKKDLRAVTASKSTGNTTNNRGWHILDTSQASQALNTSQASQASQALNTSQASQAQALNTSQASQALVQLSPHPEPQQGQHMISSSTRNFIPPTGRQILGSGVASNTQFNPGRELSLINAGNGRGYSLNLAAQSSNQNASLMGYRNLSALHGINMHTSGVVPRGYGNLSALHRNNIYASGMVPGFHLTLNQRLGNTSHIPNQTWAGSSSGGGDTAGSMNRGPVIFSGTCSHVVSNSVATTHVRANNYYNNVNLGADEAWLQMHDPPYGYFQ